MWLTYHFVKKNAFVGQNDKNEGIDDKVNILNLSGKNNFQKLFKNVYCNNFFLNLVQFIRFNFL